KIRFHRRNVSTPFPWRRTASAPATRWIPATASFGRAARATWDTREGNRMGKRIPRALFRAAAALGLSFLFLAFSLLGSSEAEDASALLPEGLLLPSPSNLIPLEGEIA